MVFIIKPHGVLDDDLKIISKIMLNMEHNKNIFKLNGTRNTEAASQKPFNCYTHQNVDFDINVSMGVILLYLPEGCTTTEVSVQKSLMKIFRNLSYENSEVPYKFGNYNSTAYTLITKKYDTSCNSTTSVSTYGSSYRKIITNKTDIKRCRERDTRFIWLIQNTVNKYLSVSELCNKPLLNNYLAKSVSTIIYDARNLFDMKHGTKQLDYPNIYQYNMLKKNRLLDKHISISQLYGLDYEILSYYYNEIKYCNIINNANYINQTLSFDTRLHDDFEIRRRNTSKDCYKQLYESFNYEEQELIETNIVENGKPSFPKDVCFITGMPLYNKAYILKVEAVPTECKNTSEEKTNSIVSYILVCPYIYHSYIYNICNKNTSPFYSGTKLGRLFIKELYITDIDRKEYDVINLIPKKMISDLSREIIYSISRYGIMCQEPNIGINMNYTLYTANLELNKIYVGLSNMYDKHIIEYDNTRTILFGYIMY
jgi:hypothetical protein